MKAMCWLAGGVLLLAVLPVQAEDSNLDGAKLTGTWSYVSGEKDGVKVDQENLKKATVVITKETLTLKGEMGDFVLKYKLDPKKTPCTIALEITEGPAGQGSKTTGIIELKDGELRICYSPMGEKIPTEFASKKDSGMHYFVLKRSKA